MKQHFSAILATAFFVIFFSSINFGQSLPCTAHLISSNFGDSLGYKSPQQALLGETFSLMSFEVEVDSFEGKITVVNGAIICFESMKLMYPTLLPQINFDSLRKSGINSLYCDRLAVQYDLAQYLNECRLVNVEIKEMMKWINWQTI